VGLEILEREEVFFTISSLLDHISLKNHQKHQIAFFLQNQSNTKAYHSLTFCGGKIPNSKYPDALKIYVL